MDTFRREARRIRRGRFIAAEQHPPLQIRDDDPTLLDVDDDDIDTDDEDDTTTTTLAAATPSPSTVLTLSSMSSSRTIPILTAISHSPTFPSSTTTARAVTETPKSSPVSATSLSSLPSPPGRQPSAALPSLSTTTSVTGSTSGPAAANGAMRPQQDGKPSPESTTRSGMPPGAEAGIVLGLIAVLGLLVTLGIVLWKRRVARRAGAIPPLEEAKPPPPPPPATRSQSEIMDELMASAYATQNGGGDLAAAGYPDEKRPASGEVAAQQPQIRSSIASWLRRHHPLNLNPQRGSTATRSTVSRGSVVEPVRPPAQRKGERTNKFVSVWSETTDSGSEGNTSILSFYGKGSRYFGSSVRGTWVFPSRARSWVAERDSNGGAAYV